MSRKPNPDPRAPAGLWHKEQDMAKPTEPKDTKPKEPPPGWRKPVVTKLLLAALVLATCACDMPSDKSDAAVSAALEHLAYGRDQRTGICFAMLASTTYYGYMVTAITQVDQAACSVAR